MTKLCKDMSSRALKVGGSHKTRSNRVAHIKRFCAFLKNSGINIEKPQHVKQSHIQKYVQHRLLNEISKRTIANEISAIRCVLKECGRSSFSQNQAISNKALGIAGSPRKGTNQAIPDELFEQILDRALQKDEGLAACLMLSRQLGLRAEEAVQCWQHLRTWHKVIKAQGTTLRVIFGTKGSRPRDATIVNAVKVYEAVDFAIAVANKRKGKLIDKPSLKTAMQYFVNSCRSLGLTGDYTPHSLRYAYAQDSLNFSKELEYTKKEALAITGCDLGHGDGRGRYILAVYGQKIEAMFDD
jgi:integrase